MSATLLGIVVFTCVAVTLVAYLVLSALMTVQEQSEKVDDDAFSDGLLFKVALPFIQYFGRIAARMRVLEGTRRGLDQRLVRAGKAYSITSDEFMGLMFVTGLAGAAVGVYLMVIMEMSPNVIVAVGLLGMMLPNLSLREAVTRRQKAILKVLPYTLDLLCLAVEAGLDFAAALNRIGEKLGKNPFRDEIRLLSRDLSMGKTRGEALRDMEKRIGLEDLTSVVSALVQADELGASLGPTLRIQSAELQRRRFQRAEKKAMQAPVLMLIPLVIFIFPLVFLVIFGPMAIRIFYGGLGF